MYASIAQQAARESHNLEVVSSNLTRGTSQFIFWPKNRTCNGSTCASLHLFSTGCKAMNLYSPESGNVGLQVGNKALGLGAWRGWQVLPLTLLHRVVMIQCTSRRNIITWLKKTIHHHGYRTPPIEFIRRHLGTVNSQWDPSRPMFFFENDLHRPILPLPKVPVWEIPKLLCFTYLAQVPWKTPKILGLCHQTQWGIYLPNPPFFFQRHFPRPLLNTLIVTESPGRSPSLNFFLKSSLEDIRCFLIRLGWRY